MTEFELMETFSNLASVMHDWVTTYFATLSAYLITAYVVGANLNRFQVLVISIGFVWFSGLCAYAGMSAALRASQVAGEISEVAPSREMAMSDSVAIAASAVMYFGIVVALIFMWQVRLAKTEPPL